MKKVRHTIPIEIEVHWFVEPEQARDRLHRWLETYGHTSVSFGFDFKSTPSEEPEK